MSRPKAHSEAGVIMVEYALMIPFLLFLTFGILQMAMLFVADSIMEYAAYSAARATLVQGINTHDSAEFNTDPLTAATLVCSLISFGGSSSGAPIEIPGWGNLPGSAYASEHTEVTIVKEDDDGNQVEILNLDEIDGSFKAIVSFDYELLFPELSLPFLSITPIEYSQRDGSRILLEKSCTMTKTF